MLRISIIVRLVVLAGVAAQSEAFAPAATFASPRSQRQAATDAVSDADVSTKTGKPTGTSFLPKETVELAKVGSPIEKIKLAKDGTSAFVDVYEYARKIREGEMTWEEVEKNDLDTVSSPTNCHGGVQYLPLHKRSMTCLQSHLNSESQLLLTSNHLFPTAIKIRRHAPSRQAHSWSIHDAHASSQWHYQFRSTSFLRNLRRTIRRGRRRCRHYHSAKHPTPRSQD